MQGLLSEHFGARLIDKPWLCDVRAANAEVIAAHNRVQVANGGEVEPKFAGIACVPSRLSDLLWSDFSHLCEGTPWLAKEAGQLLLVEVAGPSPHADVIAFQDDSVVVHAIGFRAQLLHFLHAAYSKLWMLSAYAGHADCLEEHDQIMAGEQYSDTWLLSGFFNDIELLFDRRKLYLPIEPPHWADPYDYCGRVEAARRFILAHEIGHVVWKNPSQRKLACPNAPAGFDWQECSPYVEELWCDLFAMQVMLAPYAEGVTEESRVFDVEDAVAGVLQFMILLDMVSVALSGDDAGGERHPPFGVRESALRTYIKAHPTFRMSATLRETIPRVWRRLRVLARMVGGIGMPDRNGSLWSKEEFLARLTPFGREAHSAIAKRALDELAAREADAAAAYRANRRAIERGFIPDPRDVPRFADVF